MKKLLAILTVLFTMSLSSNASAAYCEAESASAWGFGSAFSMNQACAIAVQECRIRTPYWDSCYITYRDW